MTNTHIEQFKMALDNLDVVGRMQALTASRSVSRTIEKGIDAMYNDVEESLVLLLPELAKLGFNVTNFEHILVEGYCDVDEWFVAELKRLGLEG